MKLHKLIASVFGIGYIKGGGTLAAIACCIIWFFIPAGNHAGYWQVIITLLVTIIGIWSANIVEQDWGKDSSKVVIDEVSGMMVTLLFVPVQIKYVLVGLVLFRFFDIVKPLYIRKMEDLPKGWGVMGDDILAGIYSLILLQSIVTVRLF